MSNTKDKRKLRPLKSWFAYNFWKQIFMWLFIKPKYFHFYYIVIGVIYISSSYFRCATVEPVSIFIFSLNLAGIVSSYLGVFGARKKFNIPLLYHPQKWLSEIPIFTRAATVHAVPAEFYMYSDVDVTDYEKTPKESTLEEKILVLENHLELQSKQINELKDSMNRKLNHLGNNMIYLKSESIEQLNDLDKKMKEVTTGDTSLQLLGLAWIVSAQLLSYII